MARARRFSMPRVSVAFPDASGSEAESSVNFQPGVPFPFSSDWLVVTRLPIAITARVVRGIDRVDP
jgi:hypothetical protein